MQAEFQSTAPPEYVQMPAGGQSVLIVQPAAQFGAAGGGERKSQVEGAPPFNQIICEAICATFVCTGIGVIAPILAIIGHVNQDAAMLRSAHYTGLALIGLGCVAHICFWGCWILFWFAFHLLFFSFH